jgi:hypothetical protein
VTADHRFVDAELATASYRSADALNVWMTNAPVERA